MRSVCRFRFAVAMLALMAMLVTAHAGADVRRILLIGDSWPQLMWTDFGNGRTFDVVLTEMGYGQWEEWGQYTAFTTVTARHYADNEMTLTGWGRLDLIGRELEDNPAIDIVHVSLGGNDLMHGDYSDILGDSTFSSGWKASWTPAQEEAYFDAVCDSIRVVLETALDARPDIRLALCSYDFSRLTLGGGTRLETNQAGLRLELKKRDLCLGISADPAYADRCFYINASGLTQYVYGYPYPVPDGQDAIYGPMGTAGTGGTIPKPGGYPDYDPMPGGDINYPSPEGAVLDNIHLNEEGFRTLARHCIEEFYGEWLELPKVISVERVTPDPLVPGQLYNPTAAEEVAFEVTFSEPVTGFDELDLDLVATGSIQGAAVTGLTEMKDGAAYHVTVSTGTGEGTLALAILDNDSIIDGESNPLGGAGLGNGYFAYGTPYDMDESYGLPLSTWPLLVIMGAAAGLAARRSSARGKK